MRTCLMCGKELKRKDAIFCGTACNNQNYREQRKEDTATPDVRMRNKFLLMRA